MNELMKYFNDISAEVNKEIASLQGKEFPKVLHKLYETIGSAELPYGRIYKLDLAIKTSKKSPFFPNWFVFGQDNYFSFWVCLKAESEDGYYFTTWDHELGLEIDEPVWEDLLSFLKDIEEENKVE